MNELFSASIAQLHERHQRLLQLIDRLAGSIAMAADAPGPKAPLDELREHAAFLQQAEHAITESEDKYRLLFETAGDGIFLQDGNGTFIDCNENGARLCAIPRERLIGLSPADISPQRQPDGRLSAEVAGWHFAAALDGTAQRFEYRTRRADGGSFDAEITLTPLIHLGTRCVQAVVRDISERKRTEAQNARSLSLLNATLDSTTDAILVVDRSNKWVMHNRRFAELWKIPDEIAAAKDDGAALAYVLNQLEDGGDFLKKVQDLYATPEAISFDTLRFKDGKIVERYSMPQWIDREVVGRVWSFRDVTKRVVAESKTRELNAELAATLHAIPDLLFELSRTGAYINVWARKPEQLAALRELLMGRTVSEMLPAEAAHVVLSAIAEAEAHGIASGHVIRLQRPQGDGWFELSTALKAADDPAANSFMVLSRDITDRKKGDEALRASEARASGLAGMLRLMCDNVPDMIWAKNLDGQYLFANKAICEQLLNAVGTDEPLGKDDLFFAMRERGGHPGDPDWHTFGELCQDSDTATLARGRASQFDEYGNVKGRFLFLDVHKAPFVNDRGEIIGVVGSGRDVTTQKAAEEKLQLASLIIQNGSEALLVTDAESRIVDANPAFTRITGYEISEVIGRTPKILQSGRHNHDFYVDMWSDISQTGRWQGEIWNRRKNGEIYAGWQTINTLYHEDGSVHRRVAILSDITEKKKSEEVIWTQANFDYLTRLPNRRMFRDRLSQDLKTAHRGGTKLALLFLDLDHFKEVNDSRGHDLGDALLVEAAGRISACVRESDTVARLGGDEFTIVLTLLEDTSCVGRIAEGIIRSISAPFSLGGDDVYVSASIGITLYPDDATGIEDLVKNADQAMFVSKKAGRNRYSYFTSAMQDAVQNRQRILNDLRIALAEGQFALFYQPIIELQTGRIGKAEALLRWFHPLRGMIGPAEFIPLAEESGLIREIGEWVFAEAARQVGAWRALYGSDFQVSVNISPVQMQSVNNPGQWLERLPQMGLSGQNFVFEITEGLLLDSSPDVGAQLLAFRDAGIQVAIDDFGTGYSALSYLKRFDIDYLKIDQSFIQNLAPGSSDLALSEAIVVMAHKLGLKVIAEGVETAQQLALLDRIGCDYAQGFHYSRPLPVAQFEAFLEQRSA